jgi:hypothetical protein
MKSVIISALRMLIAVPVRLILLAALISAVNSPSQSEAANGAPHTLPRD